MTALPTADPVSDRPSGAARGEPLLWMLAVLGPVVATFGRLALSHWWGEYRQIYIFFFPVLLLIAVVGRLRHGLVAVALSCVLAVYALIPPTMSFAVASWPDVAGLVVFAGVGLGMVVLGDRLRWVSQRARAHEREADRAGGSQREAERELRRRLAQIETILDAVPAIVWIAHDPEGRVITGNRAADELLGVPRGANSSRADPGAGARFRVLIGGVEARVEDLPVQRACRGESIRGVLEEIVFPDGRTRQIVGNAVPLPSPEGRNHGAVAAFMDVTAELEARTAAQASERRLRSAMQAARIGTWTCDLRTGSVSWSPELEAIFGLAPGSFGGTHADFASLVHADDLPGAEAAIASAASGGGEYEMTFRTRAPGPDCGERWISSRGRPILDGSGAVVGLEGVAMDVTERTRRDEEAERTRRLSDRIAEATPDLLYIYDLPSDRTLYTNHAAQRMLGRSAAEIVALPPGARRRLVHPDDRAARESDATLRALRTGGVATSEFRVLVPDGSYRWLRARETVFARDPDGAPVQVLGVARDITEERRVADALRESEARFRLLADSMPIVVWTATPDGETDYLNRRWFERTGLAVERTGRAAWTAALHPDDLPSAAKAWSQSVATGEPFETEHRLRHGPTGEYRWHLTRAVPVRDAGEGPITKWYGSSVDIDEQKRTLERLSGTVLDLERSNAALQEFVHIASHDLREPVRGIRNYASFVIEDYTALLDDEGRRKLYTIDKLGKRLDAMISALLQFSRVGQADLHLERVDFNELTGTVLHSVAPLLAKKHAEARRPQTFPTVRCDRRLVTDVFVELITNAVTFNTHEKRWVELGWRDEGPGKPPVFYVRDNGIGVPERHHQTVFQIFERLHGRDDFVDPGSKGITGIGAGLALVRRIVERHGGRIWIESAAHEGTSFCFTLSGDSDAILQPADRHR